MKLDIAPEAIEDETQDLEEEVLPDRYTISSYGADYPVDSLVKRLKRDDIFVPHFQRRFVWSLTQASRFVESLLLGLPVPGIFFGKDERSNRLLIIDGQQRLLSLMYFYDGVFADSGKEFALKGVQQELDNLTYKRLEDEQRRRLDDSILHATVVRQEEPTGDNSSLYMVFERLNTGGSPLSPQEIRTCVSYGNFVEFLKALNGFEPWRAIAGNVSPRMKDQELILRFFAMHENADSYASPMKGFLNDYMKRNSDIDESKQSRLRLLFEDTIGYIHGALGLSAFKPKKTLNAAVFDSVMVATARILAGHRPKPESFRDAYERLLKDPDFVSAYTKATAQEAKVAARIRLATTILGEA